MTGFEYIVTSLEIFEENLASSGTGSRILTVSALADRIGYSAHHFTRLFTAVAGVTPKEYIQGRILSEMAKRIVTTDVPLAVLAVEAGFTDYETFSRAFRSRFGMPPKRIRELHYIPFECVGRLEPRKAAVDLSLQSREPSVVAEDEIHICGMCFYMDGSEKTFHKPWAAFQKVQPLIRDRISPERFYQYSSWPSTDILPGITILCALETGGSPDQEPIFMCRTLPPARYLRFVHTGDPVSLAAAYRYIYGEYFSENDQKPAACWEFQRYGENCSTEIYIPVETA